MNTKRNEYLLNYWTSYPEMPHGALKWGRVEQSNTHNSTQLYLGRHNLTDGSFKNAPHIKVSGVLIDGDLIALMPANQITLLTPNLSKRSAGSKAWSEHQKWHEFLGYIRVFFKEKHFQEVKTPILVTCPGTEPNLEVFETYFKLGAKTIKYFLSTSPELNLKKLLAEGAEKIFEIAPVFRNGEKTNRHAPEFTMLEWYRAFAGLNSIKMDSIELIEAMAGHLKVDGPKEVLTFTVAELFKKHCNFDLKPETSMAELKKLAEMLSVDVDAATCIDDYFYLIFIDKIENKWAQDQLVFVEKYPPYQAALARIGADGWAERFEVYWRGFELGNAFHELNDPALQKQRALEDLKKKKAQAKTEINLDAQFFAALEFGLPPSAGIALGLERLYMALRNLNEISDLKRIY